MYKTLSINLTRVILTVAVTSVMLVVVFASAPRAEAQATTEIQLTITNLLERVASLRLQLQELQNGAAVSSYSNPVCADETSCDSEPALAVIAPNGGEHLTLGETHTITWDSSADIDKVYIGWSLGEGSLNWIAGATNIPNTGSFDWTVSVGNFSGESREVKIKIIGYDTGVGSFSDESDNFFTVHRTPIEELDVKVTKINWERLTDTYNNAPAATIELSDEKVRVNWWSESNSEFCKISIHNLSDNEDSTFLTKDYPRRGSTWIALPEGNPGDIYEVTVLCKNTTDESSLWIGSDSVYLVTEGELGLRDYADSLGRDFKIGSLRTKGKNYDDLELRDAVAGQEHNYSLFPSNMEVVQYEEGIFNFSSMDEAISVAEENGHELHGFHLVWKDESSPPWLGFEDSMNDPSVDDCGAWSAEELDAILKEHIQTTVERGAGTVSAWNVINEPVRFMDYEFWPWGVTCWAKILGAEDYMIKAFTYADEADPDALLFINEQLSGGAENRGIKRNWAEQYLQIIEGLQNKGTPIDGIGVQMHLDADDMLRSVWDRPVYEETLENFEYILNEADDMGLVVMITEMDVIQEVYDPEEQTMIYYDIVAMCVAHSNCAGINTWGISDKDSWYRTWRGDEDAKPLLFDDNYEKKPAYDGVMEALQGGSVLGASTSQLTRDLEKLVEGLEELTLVLQSK